MASFATTSPGPRNDQIGNKLFELLIACLAMTFSNDVELEKPRGGRSSNNPDVLLTYAGERWSLACKTLDSENPRTLVDRVNDGVVQIEKCVSCRHGIVVVNWKTLLPHEQLWPRSSSPGQSTTYEAYNDEKEPRRILESFYAKHVQRLIDEGHAVNLEQEVFAGRAKARPFIANFVHGVGLVRQEGETRVSVVTFIMRYQVGRQLRQKISKPVFRAAKRISDDLTRASQWR